MITDQFLDALKQTTETRWKQVGINPELYGFQFQPGTRWNPGLDDGTIAVYEEILGVRFPSDFRAFLRKMNGTDLPTLNVYGESGITHKESVGVYAYPKDLQLVKSLVDEVKQGLEELQITMRDQGFTIPSHSGFVPIFAHRYLICTQDESDSVVLSIHDPSDAIVYGASLANYLEREFIPSNSGGTSTPPS